MPQAVYTLDNLSILEAPPGLYVNWFETHTGASRYGRGEVLFQRVDYEAIVEAGKPTVDLEINAGDGSPGIKIPVVVVGASVVSSVSSAGSTAGVGSDVLRVTLHDKVAAAGSKTSTGTTTCKSRGSRATTRNYPPTSTKVRSIPASYGAGPTSWRTWKYPGPRRCRARPPAWKPRNLSFTELPHGRVIDDVAARLFLTVGYRWDTDSYTLHEPGVPVDASRDLYAAAELTHLAGGRLGARAKKREPAMVRVIFNVFDRTDPSSDPYANRTVKKNYTNDGGATDVTIPIYVGEYWAVRVGGTVQNDAELETVAQDVAARYLTQFRQNPGSFKLYGAWPFHPDGSVNGVRWTFGRDGTFTELRSGNDRDWHPMTELTRTIDAASNQLVVGLGETQVALGTGGTRMIYAGAGAALPTGEFEHQSYHMVSANQAGWGFPRLHGLLNES